MIETLLKIKEAEQEVVKERQEFDDELQQLRERHHEQLLAKQAENEQEIAEYRAQQQSQAEAHYDEVKQVNHQRYTETSAQLAKQFKQRHEGVVGAVLKEVKDIYGHF